MQFLHLLSGRSVGGLRGLAVNKAVKKGEVILQAQDAAGDAWGCMGMVQARHQEFANSTVFVFAVHLPLSEHGAILPNARNSVKQLHR